MSGTTEPLIAALRRIKARPATSRAEVLVSLDELQALRPKLVAARDAIGRELRALQGGLAATQAYRSTKKRTLP
jgi:hypothetical protein